MTYLRKLYQLVAGLDPLILNDILVEQPNLMRYCELELGEEDTSGIEIPANVRIKTQRNFFHQDLPWDAYLYENNKRYWADGWTELQAIRKVLKKESQM